MAIYRVKRFSYIEQKRFSEARFRRLQKAVRKAQQREDLLRRSGASAEEIAAAAEKSKTVYRDMITAGRKRNRRLEKIEEKHKKPETKNPLVKPFKSVVGFIKKHMEPRAGISTI